MNSLNKAKDSDKSCNRTIRRAFALGVPRLFALVLIFCLLLTTVAQNTPEVPAKKIGEKIHGTLNLPNAQASTLIDLYQQLSKKRLIREATITTSPVTIIAPDTVTEAEAMRLIEAALLYSALFLCPEKITRSKW